MNTKNAHRIFTIVSIVLLVFCLFACGARGPGATVTDFYRAVEGGEIETAIGFLSNAVMETMGEEKIRAALQDVTRKIDRKGGIESFEIVEEKTIGEISEIAVAIEYGDGSSEQDTVKLAQEDGEWRIQLDK